MAATRLTEDQLADVVLNLEKADENHRLWLRDLHTSAVCGHPFSKDVFSEHAHCECKFGQWYYGNGLAVLHSRPDYQELDGLHRRMHDSAREMAITLISGEDLAVATYHEFVDRQQQFSEKLLQLRDKLREHQFSFDSLTGVMTRGPFMQALEGEVARILREDATACIALLDIDHFKRINDEHGHLVGDQVLQIMGQYLVRHLRPYDSVCRYGGEEFMLCLPHTPREEAVAVMDRIRDQMRDLTGPAEGQLAFPVTASVGIAEMDVNLSLEANIDRADRALYAAKSAGRNQVISYRE